MVKPRATARNAEEEEKEEEEAEEGYNLGYTNLR